MPTLYLVPAPLGNPDDITLRALRILREVSAVAAPDSQAAQHLLTHYAITTPLITYADVLDSLSRGDVALVTLWESSDNGSSSRAVVQLVIQRGIRVEPLPGASPAITALVLSGLPTDAFFYAGALPDDLSRYARERDTLIFTTDAVLPALEILLTAFGDRNLCVAASLTLPNEVLYRGAASAALAYFRDQPVSGEVVLVVAGAPPVVEAAWDESRVRAALNERLGAGEPLKQAAKAIAGVSGWDRRTVYALGVDEKRK